MRRVMRHAGVHQPEERRLGEKITQCTSGHPMASITKALADQVIHLRNNRAANNTLLCAYCHGKCWYLASPLMLTNLLR